MSFKGFTISLISIGALLILPLPAAAQAPANGRYYFPASGPQTIYGELNANSDEWVGANQIKFVPFTTGSLTNPTTIYSWWQSIDSTKSWGVALYTDNGSDRPGSLICNVVTSSAATAGWNMMTPSGCGTLSANTRYWLAAITGSGSQKGADLPSTHCPGQSTYGFYNNSAQGSTTFPSTAGAVTQESATFGCYAEGMLFSNPPPYQPNGRTYASSLINGKSYSASTTPILIDFEGGTAGTALTSATLSSSTHGDASAWSFSSLPAETFDSSAQLGLLPRPIMLSGTYYDGQGGLGFLCTTTGSGGSCATQKLPVTATGSGTSMAIGYWFSTSCTMSRTGGTNADCGAQAGIVGVGGASYAVLHVAGGIGGPGAFFLESGGNHSSNAYSTALPNMIYRIDIQFNKGGTDYLTVCDSNLNVLGTSSDANAANVAPNQISIGIIGEEPTTAGFLYRLDDIVVDPSGAAYSQTSCF